VSSFPRPPSPLETPVPNPSRPRCVQHLTKKNSGDARREMSITGADKRLRSRERVAVIDVRDPFLCACPPSRNSLKPFGKRPCAGFLRVSALPALSPSLFLAWRQRALALVYSGRREVWCGRHRHSLELAVFRVGQLKCEWAAHCNFHDCYELL
jgi:hypothetical protein